MLHALVTWMDEISGTWRNGYASIWCCFIYVTVRTALFRLCSTSECFNTADTDVDFHGYQSHVTIICMVVAAWVLGVSSVLTCCSQGKPDNGQTTQDAVRVNWVRTLHHYVQESQAPLRRKKKSTGQIETLFKTRLALQVMSSVDSSKDRIMCS